MSVRLLHTTDGYGTHKYYADGRRVTKARYNEIWERAGRVDTLSTQRRNGQWYFYAHARPRIETKPGDTIFKDGMVFTHGDDGFLRVIAAA